MVALEHFVACVGGAPMPSQVARLTKAVATPGALERLVPRVRPLMAGQVAGLGEAFTAPCTLEGLGLVARMSTLMLAQFTGLSKALAAPRTFKRPISRVDSLVHGQAA